MIYQRMKKQTLFVLVLIVLLLTLEEEEGARRSRRRSRRGLYRIARRSDIIHLMLKLYLLNSLYLFTARKSSRRSSVRKVSSVRRVKKPPAKPPAKPPVKPPKTKPKITTLPTWPPTTWPPTTWPSTVWPTQGPTTNRIKKKTPYPWWHYSTFFPTKYPAWWTSSVPTPNPYYTTPPWYYTPGPYPTTPPWRQTPGPYYTTPPPGGWQLNTGELLLNNYNFINVLSDQANITFTFVF